jgi:hypothetical protein
MLEVIEEKKASVIVMEILFTLEKIGMKSATWTRDAKEDNSKKITIQKRPAVMRWSQGMWYSAIMIVTFYLFEQTQHNYFCMIRVKGSMVNIVNTSVYSKRIK